MKGWLSAVKTYVASVAEEQDVSDMRGNWLRVQRFYQTVQKTTDDTHLEVLKNKLPTIEGHLNRMMDLLVAEKDEYVVNLDGEGDLSSVPPCFEYLLRESDASQSGGWGGGSENDYVIFNICQYAKHDQPEGTRSVMLRVLYRLFAEVDPDTGSMLHACRDFVALPLCDALLKISLQLDPTKVLPSDSVGRAAASKHGVGKHHAHDDAKHRGGSSSNRPSLHRQEDMALFVPLLRCLAEKIERQPSIAESFMIPGSGGGQPSLLLLDKLAQHLGDAVSDLSAAKRLATFTHAARGLLALSKAPSASVQRALAGRPDILLSVLHMLQNTFVTVCKIPSNPEVRLHVSLIAECVRWIEAIQLLAPALSESWNMLAHLEEQFLSSTVLPILRSPEERTFATVATILSHIVKDVLTNTSVLSKRIAEAVLSCRVDLTHHTLYIRHAALPTDFAATTQNFVAQFLWPKIGDVSDTVAVAALQLVAALCSRAPHQFMRHALCLDGERAPLFFSRAYLDALAGGTMSDATPPGGVASGPARVSRVVPAITVSDSFPQQLVLSKGLCGTSLDGFAEDVLKQLLDMEASLEPWELNLHRPRAERAASQSSTSASFDSLPSSAPPCFCAGASANRQGNVFFVDALNQSPLVAGISTAIESMLEHPFSVNAALTELVTTMCCLPDLRVAFTVLDPVEGRFSKAFALLSQKVSACIAKDETRTNCVSRLTLYHRCAQRPFFDPSDNDETFGGDESMAAVMKSSKQFVEACICLEGLRHELSAVVCYLVVSQTLAELHSVPMR